MASASISRSSSRQRDASGNARLNSLTLFPQWNR